MEAEADLVNFGKKPTIEEEFDNLALDDDIEKELAALKSSRKKPQTDLNASWLMGNVRNTLGNQTWQSDFGVMQTWMQSSS